MITSEIIEAVRTDPEKLQKAQDRYQELLSRSATDVEFRQKLLTDPRAALREFSGREVPEGLNLVFIENRADATIVLPDPITGQGELSEAELEAVAGGVTFALVASALSVIATIGYIVND